MVYCTCKAFRQNKANSPRAARTGLGRREAGSLPQLRGLRASPGPMVQTNPIGHRPAGKTIVKAKGLGDTTPQESNCAKQTQFAPGPCEGQVLYGQRVMVYCTCTGLRQNKANPWRGRVGRSRRATGRGVNVRNKPNSRGSNGVVSPLPRPSALRPPSVGCTNKRNWPRGTGILPVDPNHGRDAQLLLYADREIGVPGRADRAKQSELTGLLRARMLAMDETESAFNRGGFHE
jgi:hypothetical protein